MPDQPTSDIQWMNRLRGHDADAFTEIYNAYWEKLLAIAFNRLSDLQAAEDIVQDVFASLWHHRQDAAITNAGAYLATAVKYKVLDRARREKLLRQYQQLYGATVSLSGAGPEAALQYKHMLELYQREVNNLPKKCQLIFRYSREQGMPVKKIAQELNISPKQWKTRSPKHSIISKTVSKAFFSPSFCKKRKYFSSRRRGSFTVVRLTTEIYLL